MLAVAAAVASSLAYSTDAVVVRSALEDMPMTVFLFILATLYAIVALVVWLWRGPTIKAYFKDTQNRPAIGLALLGLVLGTILADWLMYLAIQKSSRASVPLTITLVHTAPVLSLLLVWLVFNKVPNWKACLGIGVSVAGCMFAIFHSEDASDLA